MKTDQPANPVRIVLLCMALLLVISLITIPLLAKVISHTVGNPIQPEKLDIRPIPVPVPPQPLAMNTPTASETPATPVPVVVAIPVPTPSEVSVKVVNHLAQNATSESSGDWLIHTVSRQTVAVIVLSFTVLLTLMWLQRMPKFHSWNGKSA